MIKGKNTLGSATAGFKSQETLTPKGSISLFYKNVSSYPPRRLARTKRDKVFERIWSLVGYLWVCSISFFQLRSLPCHSDGKKSVLNAGDPGSIPG